MRFGVPQVSKKLRLTKIIFGGCCAVVLLAIAWFFWPSHTAKEVTPGFIQLFPHKRTSVPLAVGTSWLLEADFDAVFNSAKAELAPQGYESKGEESSMAFRSRDGSAVVISAIGAGETLVLVIPRTWQSDLRSKKAQAK
jgi:hypothetical protein